MFKCIVCHKMYEDTHAHVEATIEDPAHLDHNIRLRETHWTTPCFCDGTIASIDTGTGWEVYCTDCLYIYDED